MPQGDGYRFRNLFLVLRTNSIALKTDFDASLPTALLQSGASDPPQGKVRPVIDSALAANSSRIDYATPTLLPRVTGRAPVSQPEPLEAIIAKHTAVKPRKELASSYLSQSIMTGLPIFICDLLVITTCLVGSMCVVNWAFGLSFNFGIFRQLIAMLLLQSILFSLHQLYPSAGINAVVELRGIVKSTVLGLICLSAMNVIFAKLHRVELYMFALAGVAAIALIPMTRTAVRRILGKTNWWGVRVLLIGRRDDCIQNMERLRSRPHYGLKPVGYTSELNEDDAAAIGDRHELGARSNAVDIACQTRAPLVGLVSIEEETSRPERLMFQFPGVVWMRHPVLSKSDRYTANLPEIVATGMKMPVMRLIPRTMKRIADLLLCVLALLVLSLPMLMIILLIKRISPGPAFYGHRRVGQHGKTFLAWKFRSMVVDGDELLQQHLRENPSARAEWERDQKLRSDPRIIPGIGHFLRKWSLDELPQLWNVLLGQMSLVGPRPIVTSEIQRYSDSYFCYSHMVPGITGLWQVSGRNNTTYQTRVQLDTHYAHNWSPWLDLWILTKTPAVVINREGAF